MELSEPDLDAAAELAEAIQGEISDPDESIHEDVIVYPPEEGVSVDIPDLEDTGPRVDDIEEIIRAVEDGHDPTRFSLRSDPDSAFVAIDRKIEL